MKAKIKRFDKDLPSKVYLEVISKLNKEISTSRGYWDIIVNIKHPSVLGREKEVKETLENPDFIRQTFTDKRVFLFYKKYKACYLCVIVRHLNGKGFIITIYLTKKIKEGKQIWPK